MRRRFLTNVNGGGVVTPSYITIDQNLTDPDRMITGDINGSSIKWIRQNSHRVCGKSSGNGVMTVCRLDDNDSNYYHDGTPALLDGTDGDVFMWMPPFYYKAEEISPDVWRIGFSRDFVDSSWNVWDGNDLIGVYRTRGLNNLLYSDNRVYDLFHVDSGLQYEQIANARGAGYCITKWRYHCVMAALFMAMYGTTDSSSVLGYGTSESLYDTHNDSDGMKDSVPPVFDESKSVNFWGLEKWFGIYYEWIGDAYGVRRSDDTCAYYFSDETGGYRTVPGYMGGNVILKMVIGEHLDFVPKVFNAGNSDDTVGYCDYCGVFDYAKVGVDTYFISRGSGSGNGGLFEMGVDSMLMDWWNARLCFRGTVVEEKSPSVFKSL